MGKPAFRAIACLLAALAGCGPLGATSGIGDAEVAIARARAADGERLAPYETTSAELYLAKAKEEQGRAQYGAAQELAKQGQRFAEMATQKAQEQRQRGTAPAAPPPATPGKP